MWHPIYSPGTWQEFQNRKDIKSLPIMEARKKYMQEQLIFENYLSHLNTLNTVSTAVAGVGVAGGPPPSPLEPPSPKGKYTLVEGGEKAYYWFNNPWVDNVYGDVYTPGTEAGTLYETTTTVDPNNPAAPNGNVSPSPSTAVYSSDEAGTTVFKWYDLWGGSVASGDWAGELEPYIIPTNLGMPDYEGYSGFKPFVDTPSPSRRALSYYGVQSLALGRIDAPLYIGDNTDTTNPRHILTFPSRFTNPTLQSADWSKIMRPEIDIMNVTMVLTGDSTLPAELNNSVWGSEPDDSDENDMWYYQFNGSTSGNLYLLFWNQITPGAWDLYNVNTATLLATNPSFDNLFTGGGSGPWAAGIQSFGAY